MKTPYRVWAPTYFALGWSPIPLKASEKHPVPDHSPISCRCRSTGGEQCCSYTGASGKYVDMPDMQAWSGGARARAGRMLYQPGNIAFRLPQNAIGIDVDTYGGKAGAATLAKAEKAWGALPATWVSANRMLTPSSGIRLFRLPPGTADLAWPESLLRVPAIAGGGVELIRWDHRYAMVAPSVHPDGRVYFWRTPGGAVVDLAAAMAEASEGEVELPEIADLTELPAAWVAGLTEGRARSASVSRAESAPLLDRDAVIAWLGERTRTLGELKCAMMEKTLTRYLREVRTAGDDGGAHDIARDGAWALIGDAAAGHAGVEAALVSLRSAFMSAVAGRRSERVADAEWARVVIRGVSKLAAEGEVAEYDRCVSSATTTRPRGRAELGVAGARPARRASGTPFEYSRDDRGNARRLYNALGRGADVRWCPGLGGWYLWDENERRWLPDVEGLQLKALWSDIVDEMELEIEFMGNELTPATAAALRRFTTSCGNLGRMETALKVLRTLPGIFADPGIFDANERVLQAGTDVIELTPAGARVRPAEREDYLTQYIRQAYIPRAHDPFGSEGGVNAGAALWWKFISEAVPDETVRRWLQIAVGYSLYGSNPERLCFIVQGETSSGKSTFIEAIRGALGDYGGVFNFSLFRSEREQGPNVALVNLMPKRFIVASEASQNRHLHADEIKRIVGNESLSARNIHSTIMITRRPAFTPWIATNDAPTVNGADLALFRRLMTVHFGQRFEHEDTSLGERLRDEAGAAILAWAVEGWDLGCADRKALRNPPQGVADATAQLRGELNDFGIWLRERAKTGDIADITATDDLWADWEMWSETNGVERGSKVEFGRNLGRNGFEKALGRRGEERFRAWRGIALRR